MINLLHGLKKKITASKRRNANPMPMHSAETACENLHSLQPLLYLAAVSQAKLAKPFSPLSSICAHNDGADGVLYCKEPHELDDACPPMGAGALSQLLALVGPIAA
jgi:hypothetical protein